MNVSFTLKSFGLEPYIFFVAPDIDQILAWEQFLVSVFRSELGSTA